jgi:CARDB
MRRALPIAALTVAAALALPAAAGAAPAPASVKLVKCSFQNHEAAFYARMQTIPGATRMALRFTLLQETADDFAQRIKVPGLRRWRMSKPGVRTFGYRQGFRNLPENASHRVRVGYRWYAEDGTELARATRRSARCDQFVELPNFVARIAAVLPTKVNGVVRYRTLVLNNGKAAASSVAVRLTVDGKVVDTVTLASLDPGEQRSVVIRGPACTRLAKLEVDPEKAIAASSDADNADELGCAALR